MTSTTKKGFAYLCTAGHIDVIPTMGTFAGCQSLVPVVSRNGQRGSCPCNQPVVEVPDPDGSLEAMFRVGGPQAVLAAVAERVGREDPPAGAQPRAH